MTNQDWNQLGPEVQQTFQSQVVTEQPHQSRGSASVMGPVLVRFTWSHLSNTHFYLCKEPEP